MPDTVPRSPAPGQTSLPALLADRARNASDTRLALNVACGILVSAASLYWRPAGWLLLLSGAICLAAFGGWGIVDRELRERQPPAGSALERALRALRVAAAVLGGLAAAVFGAVLLAVMLGPMIS